MIVVVIVAVVVVVARLFFSAQGGPRRATGPSMRLRTGNRSMGMGGYHQLSAFLGLLDRVGVDG
eukprot:7886785-Pyramimonas_sp.AAC.1